MTEDKDRTNAEAGRIAAVLGALAEARPDEGLERRVLQRLAAESLPKPQPVLAGWFVARPWRVASVAVASAVCAAAVLMHSGGKGRVEQAASPVSPQHARAALQQPKPALHQQDALPYAALQGGSASPREVGFAQRERGLLASAAHQTQHLNLAATEVGARNGETPLARESGAAGERSFPAPPMPLTEQEQMLLQIAHRNDPVQVAMLDAVERDRVSHREHAATASFLAPVPLPVSLQKEVNAALRSQYVNTPPPRELDVQTNE